MAYCSSIQITSIIHFEHVCEKKRFSPLFHSIPFESPFLFRSHIVFSVYREKELHNYIILWMGKTVVQPNSFKANRSTHAKYYEFMEKKSESYIEIVNDSLMTMTHISEIAWVRARERVSGISFRNWSAFTFQSKTLHDRKMFHRFLCLMKNLLLYTVCICWMPIETAGQQQQQYI